MKINVLKAQLEEMEDYISHKAQYNSAVSSAPVGWHLAHNLKVITNVVYALESSRPEEYRKQFNFMRMWIFLTRKIPRGKAKAPMVVHPPENITGTLLKEALLEAENKVNSLSELNKRAYFRHPFFHNLDRDQTKKFLEIHTAHHLKIIRDILK